MSLQEIKRKINSIQKTSKITRAMALVSTSKYNSMVQDQKNYQRYAHELEGMVQRLFSYSAYLDLADEADQSRLSLLPYVTEKSLKPKQKAKKAYLIITSDKGLAGSYNSQLLNFLKEQELDSETSHILAIGQAAVKFSKQNNLKLSRSFYDVADQPDHHFIQSLVDEIAILFQQESIQSMELVYNDLINPLQSKVRVDQLLPIRRKDYDAKDLRPEYLFEDDIFTVVDQLLEMYVESALLDAILKAKIAEHASRMQAMQQATDNADGLIEDLRSDYHQARQLNITNEMIEVISGSNAQIEEE